jgi:hypothetical protein
MFSFFHVIEIHFLFSLLKYETLNWTWNVTSKLFILNLRGTFEAQARLEIRHVDNGWEINVKCLLETSVVRSFVIFPRVFLKS